MQYSTIPQIMLSRLERSADQILFYAPESTLWPSAEAVPRDLPAPEGYRAFNGTLVAAQLSGLARRLHSLGVDRGVKVAILADTNYAWAAVDGATLVLGGVTIGIYPSLLGEQVAWQLRHGEVSVLVVQGEEQHQKIAPFLDDLPDLRHVLSMDAGVEGAPQLSPAAPDPEFLVQRARAVQPEDVATIVYTSGTTGVPKGVVLTHGALAATLASVQQACPLYEGETSVVFLPFAHILQRFTSYQGMLSGVVGYYAPSIQALPEVLQLAQPELLGTVPRMLEKIKAKAEATADARGPSARRVLDWGVAVGRAMNHHKAQGSAPPARLRLQAALADRLVYRKVRQRLGGRMRLVVSGGAALSVEVSSWFEALGVPVREAWGLSETCAPATFDPMENPVRGTVGRAIPGMEVKLDADGEVLVRGPGLFSGYYKDPEATAAAFTADGFFRTGDLGAMADGFLRIVDRKKEIIVTAGGKNISPVAIEKKLEGGLVGQAVVVGSERPYLVALLAPEPDALAALAAAGGWPGGPADWAARPEVEAQMAARVAEANASLPGFEQVKRFAVLPGPLTQEADELTPSLKLKRRVISDRYQDRIAALYAP